MRNSINYLKKKYQSFLIFFKNRRREPFQTPSIRPVLPNIKTKQRHYNKRKLQTNIIHGHRGKNSSQNIRKAKPATYKIKSVYFRNARFI